MITERKKLPSGEEFTVNEYECIVDPGKFEGLPTWALWFYNLRMEGLPDETIHEGDIAYDYFEVDKEATDLYPDLRGVEMVCLWEREDGFLVAEKTTRAELEWHEKSVLEDDEDEDDDL